MKTKADLKATVSEKKSILIELTSKFCDTKLNEEYKNLCKKLIEKLSRKRTVPFLSGRIEIWAAAIIYALGSINFLFDKSSKPYIKSDEISSYFGTSTSTISQKAKVIRDMFNLNHFSSEFLTQKMHESLVAPIVKTMEVLEWRSSMSKIEEITGKLNPLLDELITEMKKQKLPGLKAINVKGYEVIIKKQDFKMPDFPPPKCKECGHQMTYDDWFEEDDTYFCPDFGEPFERDYD